MQPSQLLLALALLGTSCALVGSADDATAAEDKRIALVIGNSAYRDAQELPNPRNDARAVGEALQRLGFEVDTELDLTQSDLQTALREFGYQAELADVAVVFYAGHGIQISNENYLLPVDAMLRRERDLIYEALPLAVVMDEVAQARRLGLVIVDACRDNPLADRLRQALGPVRSGLVGTGLARIEDVPSDTMVAFSTRPGEIAIDGAGQNSPYTEALLRHLEEPGIELNLLFRKVRDTVLQLTAERQEPRTYDALGAEPFFFKEQQPNQRPEIAQIAAVQVSDTAEATPIGIPAPSDPDGDRVSIQVTGLPRDGMVAVGGHALLTGDVLSPHQLAGATYTPSGQFTGDAGPLAFLVRDDRGGLAIGSVTINVVPSNQAPIIAAQQMLRVPAIPLNIEPPVDPDGDPLTITVAALPERGEIKRGGRTVKIGEVLTTDELAELVLEPGAQGASGIFAFEVADPDGATATSALQINVPAFSLRGAPETPAIASEQVVAVELAPPQLETSATRAIEPARPAPRPVAARVPEQAVERAGPTPGPVAARVSKQAVERPRPGSTAGDYVARRDANIRAEPSPAGRRLATVAEGGTLRVLRKVEGREWYEVETGEGVKGYIYADLVEPVKAPPMSAHGTPLEQLPAPPPGSDCATWGLCRRRPLVSLSRPPRPLRVRPANPLGRSPPYLNAARPFAVQGLGQSLGRLRAPNPKHGSARARSGGRMRVAYSRSAQAARSLWRARSSSRISRAAAGMLVPGG